MLRGSMKLFILNPHVGDISRNLLARILRQAGISRDEWEALQVVIACWAVVAVQPSAASRTNRHLQIPHAGPPPQGKRELCHQYAPPTMGKELG